jgi:cullin 3
MLADLSISKNTLNDYRSSSSFRGSDVEFEVSVLTQGHWPDKEVAACTLPASLKYYCDNFSQFYTGSESTRGRRLAWYLHMGSVDVRATFNGVKRELTVSTYQACILELFNTKTSLSLHEIRSHTNIIEGELRRHLLSLCTSKIRILNKSSKDKVFIHFHFKM